MRELLREIESIVRKIWTMFVLATGCGIGNIGSGYVHISAIIVRKIWSISTRWREKGIRGTE